MSLPEADARFLSERKIEHVVQDDGGMVCVLLIGWQLPSGLNVAQADILLRLSPGYPDVAPDMWWVEPALRRQDGSEIPATQVTEQYIGRTWQRWSRHFAVGQWQSGVDGLESYLALMRAEFEIAAGLRAA
jgi:hypothetical protein